MSLPAPAANLLEQTAEARDFSWVERYALIRSHPRRILVDLAALPWIGYFLWNQKGWEALTTLFFSSIAGLYLSKTIDYEYMAKTVLGKIALLHLHPINLSLQILGFIQVGYALWNHSPQDILAGITFICLGHLWGWSQVNPKL